MRRTSHIAFALAALLIIPGLARSQSLSWQLQPNGPKAPSPRADGGLAYDPAARQILMFGGADSSGSTNDLWAYSLDKQYWTQLTPTGTLPPARSYHAVAWDSLRRRLLVFGGISAANLADAWAYSLASNSWQLLAADGAGPAARHGVSAIYDEGHDRMVISHGFTNTGRTDDTWALDLSTNTWRDISPAVRPLRRCLHHASYDAATQQMYLYGGCSSGYGPCPDSDLWSLDLNTNTWTARGTGALPPGRQDYAMAFDPTGKRLRVFAGFGSTPLSDTWEFDPTAAQWTSVSFASPTPSARSRVLAVEVAGRGMYVFGGAAASGFSNELWLLGPSATVVNAFSGLGGVVAPGEIVSVYGAGLGPVSGLATSFDAQTELLPVAAGGVSVKWNGTAAPLYYVSGGQLNVQVPYELAGSTTAALTISYGGVQVAMASVPEAATHPGVFPLIFNSDGSANSATNPAAAGSVIYLFGTGQGVTNPPSITGADAVSVYPDPAASVSLTADGRDLGIVFKGQAPFTAGVFQVNARLPADLGPGTALPLVLTVGGAQAQSGLTVAVK